MLNPVAETLAKTHRVAKNDTTPSPCSLLIAPEDQTYTQRVSFRTKMRSLNPLETSEWAPNPSM